MKKLENLEKINQYVKLQKQIITSYQNEIIKDYDIINDPEFLKSEMWVTFNQLNIINKILRYIKEVKQSEKE